MNQNHPAYHKPSYRAVQDSRKIFLLIIITILIFSGALPGCAPDPTQNNLGAIFEEGVIKVGTSPNYPPFEYIDKSGKRAGFDIDLMTEIAKRMGVKLEWIDNSYENLISDVQSRITDMAISAIYENEEFSEKVAFTDVYFIPIDALVVRYSSDIHIIRPEQIKEYITGVEIGSLQDGWLTKQLEANGQDIQNSLIRYDRLPQAIDNLINGKINLILMDNYSAEKLVQDNRLKIIFKSPISAKPIRMAVPKGDSELLDKLNSIIRELESEKFIQGLIEKNFILF